MADDAAVTLADSASTAQAATDPVGDGQAAASTEATHGEATELPTTDTATDTPAPSEAQADDDDDDDEHEEPDPPDLSPDEQKSRSQERRERRRAREAARTQKLVDEALARKDQERAAEASKQAQTEAAQKAAEARAARFAAYLGEPDKPDGTPGTLRRLDQEIDALVTQLASPDVWSRPGDEIDTLQKDLAAKRVQKAGFATANGLAAEMQSFVWDDIWGRLKDDFASAAEFPEMAADPTAKARYLNAAGGVRGGLVQLRETIVRAKDAERDAALKQQADQHAAEVATITTDRNAWRTRAGGAEVPTTTNGGQAESSSLTLTPQRYAAMSLEERQKLRSTPEGRMRINAMTTGAPPPR